MTLDLIDVTEKYKQDEELAGQCVAHESLLFQLRMDNSNNR